MIANKKNQYTKPFNEVTGVIAQLQSAFSSVRRLLDLLDEEGESKDVETSFNRSNFIGNIEFSNVCFSYNKSKKLIENLNKNLNAQSVVQYYDQLK